MNTTKKQIKLIEDTIQCLEVVLEWGRELHITDHPDDRCVEVALPNGKVCELSTGAGICDNFAIIMHELRPDMITSEVRGVSEGEFRSIFIEWEHYSGNIVFPVKGYDAGCDERVAYMSQSSQWAGTYGAYRIKLAEFLLETYRKRLKEAENV